MAFPHALPTPYPPHHNNQSALNPTPHLSSLLTPPTPPSPIVHRAVDISTFHPKTSFAEPPALTTTHPDTAVLHSQLQVLGRLRSKSAAEGGGGVREGEGEGEGAGGSGGSEGGAVQLGPAPALLSVA